MSEVTPNESTPEYPALNDFETDVFNECYPVMDSLLPEGNFRSEYVREYESLPLCTLVRMDSIPDWKRESTSDEEDYSIETYEARAYADSMEECKAVMNTLAAKLRSMNFRRLTMRPVLNGNDTRVQQIVARFEHSIDSQGRMFRT